jgi:hypothetical protein
LSSHAARCAELADRLGEPMVATAGRSSAWLALEETGAWGARAPGESGLDPELSRALSARAEAAGLAVLLIRGAGSKPRRRCLLAHGGERATRFLEFLELESAADVLELDLQRVACGRPTGAGRVTPARHFLTCVNGKRAPCCALRGRPVARALAAAIGDRSWQCTHLGGHRFAANVLALPDGLVFGRLNPDSAVRVAHELDEGRLVLDHLRGRSGRPAAVQAAELLLRRRLGIREADAVVLREVDPPTFSVGGQRYEVVVSSRPAPPRPTSCRADKYETPLHWTLESVTATQEASLV